MVGIGHAIRLVNAHCSPIWRSEKPTNRGIHPRGAPSYGYDRDLWSVRNRALREPGPMYGYPCGKTYKLHVPANLPGKQFWSVTAYDEDTRQMVVTEQGAGLTRNPWPHLGPSRERCRTDPPFASRGAGRPDEGSGLRRVYKSMNLVRCEPGIVGLLLEEVILRGRPRR